MVSKPSVLLKCVMEEQALLEAAALALCFGIFPLFVAACRLTTRN